MSKTSLFAIVILATTLGACTIDPLPTRTNRDGATEAGGTAGMDSGLNFDARDAAAFRLDANGSMSPESGAETWANRETGTDAVTDKRGVDAFATASDAGGEDSPLGTDGPGGSDAFSAIGGDGGSDAPLGTGGAVGTDGGTAGADARTPMGDGPGVDAPPDVPVGGSGGTGGGTVASGGTAATGGTANGGTTNAGGTTATGTGISTGTGIVRTAEPGPEAPDADVDALIPPDAPVPSEAGGPLDMSPAADLATPSDLAMPFDATQTQDVPPAFDSATTIDGPFSEAGGCATPNSWCPGTPSPYGRWGAATGVIEGKWYVCGDAEPDNVLLVYDPVANQWQTKAPAPSPCGYSGDVIDNKFYTVSSTFQRYDPSTDSWATDTNHGGTLAVLPVSGGALGVVGRKLFASGCTGSRGPLYAYDPDTNVWVAKADMPTPRCAAGTAVVNNRIYVVGGLLNGACCSAYTTTNEEYDPSTDTWRSRAPMTVSSYNLKAEGLNGQLYVVGGFNWSTLHQHLLRVYNPAMNIWQDEAPMAQGREAPAVGLLDGKLFVLGGNGADLTSVEIYTP